MLVCWLYECLSRDLSLIPVCWCFIARKSEEQLDCGTGFSGVLALAEETRDFSEPTQLHVMICLCSLMLDVLCTPSVLLIAGLWLFGPLWSLPRALDPKYLDGLF